MAATETGNLPSGTMRVPVLILSLACSFPMILQAQEQDPSVMRVAVNLVMVDVTAKTKAGQILGDLKKEDFELREDGAAQKVEIFSRDELPLNVALVPRDLHVNRSGRTTTGGAPGGARSEVNLIKNLQP